MRPGRGHEKLRGQDGRQHCASILHPAALAHGSIDYPCTVRRCESVENVRNDQAELKAQALSAGRSHTALARGHDADGTLVRLVFLEEYFPLTCLKEYSGDPLRNLQDLTK